MILVLKTNVEEKKIEELIRTLESSQIRVERTKGVDYTILALIGDTRSVNEGTILNSDIVHRIIHVQEPYKQANRLFHPENTTVKVGDCTIGGGEFAVIAGPCSVESEEQILTVAREVKKSGAKFLRGGAYKPRTSPYSFQGLGERGLDLLKLAKEETGLLIVSEILSTDQLDRFVRDVDIIQVGARNMQNFSLLKELGRVQKPVILKRGMSATMEEWLMSAEYIMAEGNKNVILCERGIRTFETYTRNTFDISAIPMIKHYSHLPIIADPSHATGRWWMVEPLAKAAVAAGADGLMVEVHPNPEKALSDGAQSLTLESYKKLMNEINLMIGKLAC
ncbi:MAG: 3-deoxy-7-phosphoheptulonate synthase [Clostridia bacterium]|jgi:3-deoxy-7-phosphoheptulonate synthase|nr:3-deoxy-7-phosphoheptulonate synthase [Clostridiaceae bacterium]